MGGAGSGAPALPNPIRYAAPVSLSAMNAVGDAGRG